MDKTHDVTSNELQALIGHAMCVPMLVTASLLSFFVVYEIGLGLVLAVCSFVLLYVLIGEYEDIREKLDLS